MAQCSSTNSYVHRAKAPLVAIEMLALPSVRWGNLAALTIFSMEAGLVFPTTLYPQNVLHFGPLATGLVFGVPGLASVAAGVVAGRIIARRRARTVLLVALLEPHKRLSTWVSAPSVACGPSYLRGSRAQPVRRWSKTKPA
jgi:hypothetical protein